MGHTRLGKIPTTRKWREVVGIFTAAKSAELTPDAPLVSELAASTLRASKEALREGVKDGGLAYVFYLLTQIALSVRRQDASEALRSLGLQLSHNSSHFDFTVELHRVIDKHFRESIRRSDVGEMAQLAAGETLTNFFRSQPRDLFTSSQDQLFRDLRSLGTQTTFGAVARTFFSNFMSRMLGFYLSKFVLPGGRQKVIDSANDLTKFNEALKQHAHQRAAIIHEFAEKWFSKTEFEQGIEPNNTRRFVAYACKKLEDEFLQRPDGE